MATDTSNLHFQMAARFVNQTGKHVFLTGKAGTGKTTFLRYIKDNSFKKMAVVAPTGVAAMNAGGMTIHSFFNLPFGTFIHNAQTAWGADTGNVYNKNQLFHKAKLSSAKRSIIREIDLLVIDEVSMVRADILDAMDTLLRATRKKQEPFGGVQLLFIGDLFQLPPVVKNEDWKHLQQVYASPFFFDALVMQEAAPVCIELEKIYRQQDLRFIELLNNVRNNHCNPGDYQLLRELYRPAFEPAAGEDFITLTSHNAKADAINRQKMEQLPGKPISLEGNITGDFPENAYPAEKILSLKEGAQIMFIKNDKGEARRYFNGKIGIVESIDTQQDQILIRFPGEPNSFAMEKETWRNIRYEFDAEKDRITEEELGSFTQYPIRLAWAVTIHKSQGLTFQRAMVDAGRSFAPGQVYVALSRLTGLEGLVLKSPIEPASISTDPHVMAFSKRAVEAGTLQQLLEAGQKEFAGKSMLQAFDWSKIKEDIRLFTTSFDKRAIPNKELGYILFLDLSRLLAKLEEVGNRFSLQLQTILQQGETAYEQLEERTQAAANWFLNELDQRILPLLVSHVQEMKGKQRIKKYLEEIKGVQLIFERKKIHLQQVNAVTQALAGNMEMQEVMNEVHKMLQPAAAASEPTEPVKETTAAGKPAKGETKRISLEMYRAGKTIREIAQERELVLTTIEGHLTSFIASGEIAVHAFIPEEKIPAVEKIMTESEAMPLSAIKEKLGDQYSYLEIKAVQQYLRYKETQPGST